MENSTDIQEQAELDMFTHNAKSSVKLIKNSKGINWEIKVVSGEKDLIDGLMQSAIKAHKGIENNLNKQEEN